MELARELRKAAEHEADSDANRNWYVWNGPQRLGKGAGRVGNPKTNEDHTNVDLTRELEKNYGT